MSKDYSLEIDAEGNSLVLFCQRLCRPRFDSRKMRSLSAVLSERDILKIEKYSSIRGQWNNRVEYLLSCIGFSVGLGNVWRFPNKVYYGGGGTFLIVYTCMCLLFGIPLLLFEMGLGQFSGRSPLRAFKLVPMFYGIGWCMFIINIMIVIYYSVIMAWGYFYLFGSLSPSMPWVSCDYIYNTRNCFSSIKLPPLINDSLTYVSSAAEFWDYAITGFVKFPTNKKFTMNEDPGRPQWHLTLCLIVVWLVAAFGLMLGVRISGKLIYFSVLFPFVALITLIILGFQFSGAFDGVKFYLAINWNSFLDPLVYRGALEQLFFSVGIGMGGMITFSSYNGIRDNIYRDAIIVVFVDYLASLLAGFAVFQMLGYIAVRNRVAIDKLVPSGMGLIFIIYSDALSTLSGANFWTFLFMLMIICLGMGSQFAMVETVVTGVVDICPMVRESRLKKAIFVWLVCFVFFTLGLLLCSPGGLFYFGILDLRVTSYGLPLIVFFEAVFVGIIYGIKQLRYDFRMLFGYSLSWVWFIMMAYVCPLLIIVILLASVTQHQRINISKEFAPVWGEVLAVLFLLIVMSPIVVGIVDTVYRFYSKYPNIKGKAFIKLLITPPVYWGPMYLKHWLLGSFYRQKLLRYRGNPELYKYAPDYQHLEVIVSYAKESM